MKSVWTFCGTFFARSIGWAPGIIFLLSIGMTQLWAQGTFEVVHPFTVAKGPEGALARDAAGNLYGTTRGYSGGGCKTPICGSTVWRLSPNGKGGWTSTLLHFFSGSYTDPNGTWAEGGVVLDAAGNLYGVAPEGGASTACTSGGNNFGCGVVFRMTANADGSFTYSVLHNFDFLDGFAPSGPLVFDKSGNLYGVTARGGSSTACGGNGCGLVFELSPSSGGTWTETVIHTFSGTDGSSLYGSLTFDAAGNLYGAAQLGGGSGCSGAGCGVIFKLAPNTDGTWTESTLYSFTGGADGSSPIGGLVFDANGHLYGAAGVVFQLTPNSGGPWTETVIGTFPEATGNSFPHGQGPNGVTFDAAGNLYGTTFDGGTPPGFECSNGCGVVFRVSPGATGWSLSVVHEFVGYGSIPESQLLVDPAGHVFGTTMEGDGINGLVFEITP